jgi:hypothetical protein
VNPVGEIVARAHEVGALTFIDAVAYAPHGPIDVHTVWRDAHRARAGVARRLQRQDLVGDAGHDH